LSARISSASASFVKQETGPGPIPTTVILGICTLRRPFNDDGGQIVLLRSAA
jgi:hypothetical protein